MCMSLLHHKECIYASKLSAICDFFKQPFVELLGFVIVIYKSVLRHRVVGAFLLQQPTGFICDGVYRLLICIK